ncbi:MAG: hypothetical protein JW882_12390 [Deltaproteobacteria bacterium]|nr:hypothetical protein [Deltaproteobacteria bacterium]
MKRKILSFCGMTAESTYEKWSFIRGTKKRRLRHISNTPQACREPPGRTRGAIAGNAADSALMVDQK